MRLPAPAAVDGGGALVCGQEGVKGLAQRQESVVKSPHSWKGKTKIETDSGEKKVCLGDSSPYSLKKSHADIFL